MKILEKLAASIFNELNYSYPHFKLHLSFTSFRDSDIFLQARHIFLYNWYMKNLLLLEPFHIY